MEDILLKQGYSYKLDVIKDSCDRKRFKVKSPDGNEYFIQKFKFQYDQPVPDQLQCYVKQVVPSVIIAQDISDHIKNFYKQGNEYEFKVIGSKQAPNTHYDLTDQYGLCFKIYNPSITLFKGDMIKCRIMRIKDASVSLHYVGTLSPKFPILFLSMKEWLSKLEITADAVLYEKWLKEIPEFEPVMKKYEEGDASWIIDLLQVGTKRITEWLIDCKDDIQLLKNINRKLNLAKRLSLYILEESDYLRSCNQEQRSVLQSRLSNYVELYEQYHIAISKILSGSHEEYIDRMFSRLKNAGYLYEPKRQIRIMMTILKLRPELINERMGELFETLHNWPLVNWQSEPFREALVRQLQIFIEENYWKVNLVALNDTASANKVVSRLILALAVQRLLTIDKDEIDLNLNRAILYRYSSYLIPDESEILLQNAVDSLLGYDWPNEFTWDTIETPSLLFIKMCNQHSDDTTENIIKTYSTSKADIQIQKDGIHIIAPDADPDTTVIPNNMFDWLNPKISLSDDIDLNLGKKNNQLKDYRKLWDEIRWSLFRGEESELVHIEKIMPPQEEEEINIIIDDIRIIDDVHEKQKLQLHCTINDDYYYGDGWMPCDNFHFVPWLSYKDIPNNFDGTLSFCKSENGMPLIFKANVSNRKGILNFSLKNQIENYLLDNSYPGQESVVIITALDKINNCWICLSEQGASYKVAYDNTTSHLSIGNIIRVSYFEPDRSNQSTQFFIGTYSANQEGLPTVFNKNVALKNLMQNIGTEITPEEDFQVVESEKLMTREELIEFIYILRRRAYWESEYVKAYNYLGLASILVRIVDEPILLNEITLHMDLLELLQEFGKNRKVDLETLDQFDHDLSKSPMLERLFTRLKIVSCLETNEKSNWLWEISSTPRNKTEGELASLVLSYNLLPRELESSKKQILTQITTLLNVNSTTINSKYYGDENQKTEFKSSLIFSPKEGSKAAVKEQLREITHIICGFMNARGGKLYIGVNDSGYENGLEDDLAYRKKNGQKPTIDAMIVDLQNHLDRTLPPHAKDHWEIYSDSESKKGVIVVEILPVREPVEFEDTIFVRSSCVTKPRLNAEREEFIKNRAHNYDNLMKLWGVTPPSSDDNEIHSTKDISDLNNSNKEKSEEKKNVSESSNSSSDNEKIKKTIFTGKHRHNVLHEYEESYVEPEFYLYFRSDGYVTCSINDLYKEDEDDCSLVLAVNEKEDSANLILTDDNNEIRAIPFDVIKGVTYDMPHKLSQNSDITIANIGSDNDYLLSVIRIAPGSLYYRLDKIAEILHSDELLSKGATLIDAPYDTIVQEIVKPDKLDYFSKDSIIKDNKVHGIPVPIGDGTLTEEERINLLITPLQIME